MILIFDSELKGHHLEYIHHYWSWIANNDSTTEYVFALPKSEWLNIRSKLKWQNVKNIKLRLIEDSELINRIKYPILKRAIFECRLIRKIVKEFNSVEKIFMSNLSVAVPLLHLYIPKQVKISGIIYNIPIYRNYSRLARLKNKLYFKLIGTNRSYDKVFLLNTKTACDLYNNKYNTLKFTLLPDPVPFVDKGSLLDIRESLHLGKDAIIFLHFGALQRRKGTLELLKALQLVNINKNKYFILVGEIDDSIKDDFHILANIAKERGVNIIIKDAFIDFEELNNLCFSSDCILAPYLDTGCSSGVIGYGAVFGKPIIGSKEGLLGELISSRNLGITISPDPIGIANAINNFVPYKIVSDYTNTNTIENFCKSIFV